MLDTLCLTRDELVALTGYRLASKQAEWLRHNRIKFFRAADGSVRVVRAHLEGISRPSNNTRREEPDFSALHS